MLLSPRVWLFQAIRKSSSHEKFRFLRIEASDLPPEAHNEKIVRTTEVPLQGDRKVTRTYPDFNLSLR